MVIFFFLCKLPSCSPASALVRIWETASPRWHGVCSGSCSGCSSPRGKSLISPPEMTNGRSWSITPWLGGELSEESREARFIEGDEGLGTRGRTQKGGRIRVPARRRVQTRMHEEEPDRAGRTKEELGVCLYTTPSALRELEVLLRETNSYRVQARTSAEKQNWHRLACPSACVLGIALMSQHRGRRSGGRFPTEWFPPVLVTSHRLSQLPSPP